MDRFLIQSLPNTKRVRRLQTDENVDDPITGTDVSPTSPTSSTENVQKNLKFQFLFIEFYKLVSINADKIIASCVNCHKNISAWCVNQVE